MISAIFKSPLPSFSFFFKNGMTAVFMHGRFVTGVKEQIRELMEEVGEVGVNKSRHPYIYVNDYEIDSEALSPMELVRMKAKEEARQELLEEQRLEQARAMNVNNVSNTQSDAFKTSLANSRTIEQVLNAGNPQPVAGVGIGVAAHNNPMASDVLVPTVTVPVNVPTPTGVVIQESAQAQVSDPATAVKSIETAPLTGNAKLMAMAANLKKD